MSIRTHSLAVALILAVAGAAPQLVHADIVGFNSLSGWTYNTTDAATPPAVITSDSIQFTGGPANRRSLWFNTPQAITSFEASFTYRASNIAATGGRQAVTFTMQNSAAGLSALGVGGTGFGYQGITPSAAVTIELDTGPARTYNGFYSGGVMGGGSTVTTPVNAFNLREIDVTISYSGSILTVTMVDGADVFGPHNYFVGSLSSVVGGPSAFVGFTGSTGNGANQFLSDFRFSVPTPGAAALLGLSGMMAMGRRRR